MDHHAYLYEGSPTEFDALKDELKPFVARKYERFGIDDARELVALAALRKEGEARYLVAASTITTEAQQALLKLLEEPQPGVVFYLLFPHGSLLPTVKSRLMPYTTVQGVPLDKEAGRQAKAFLKAAGKARSDMVAALLKDDVDVKERVLNFVNALEAEVYRAQPGAHAALADLARVRDYLRDRSPSNKMLLEHLALSLPTV